MSVDGSIQHHQPPSSPAHTPVSLPVVPAAAAAAAGSGGIGGRVLTDHSVRSLLQQTDDAGRAPGSSFDQSACFSPARLDQSACFTPVRLPHQLIAAHLSHAAGLSDHVTCVDDVAGGSDVIAGSDVTVSARLEHKELWDRFNALGTEMVITKSGR